MNYVHDCLKKSCLIQRQKYACCERKGEQASSIGYLMRRWISSIGEYQSSHLSYRSYCFTSKGVILFFLFNKDLDESSQWIRFVTIAIRLNFKRTLGRHYLRKTTVSRFEWVRYLVMRTTIFSIHSRISFFQDYVTWTKYSSVVWGFCSPFSSEAALYNSDCAIRFRFF